MLRTYLSLKIFNFKEFLFVLLWFPSFLWTECLFCIAYFCINPYRQSVKNQPENIYGETPLSTLKTLIEALDFSPRTILDLGSGRGRGVFFLSHLLGCKVIGIEKVSCFVKIAKGLKKFHPHRDIEFYHQDMLKNLLPNVDVVYFYGTCLEDKKIQVLIELFKQIPTPFKVLSVSYPLSDYSEDFETEKEIPARYPWGETTVYVNRLLLV